MAIANAQCYLAWQSDSNPRQVGIARHFATFHLRGALAGRWSSLSI